MPSGTITPSAPSVRTDFSNGLKAPTRSSYWALCAERFCQLELYSTSCISSLVPDIIASGSFVSSTAYYFAQITASICGTNPVHCWILHCGVRCTGTNTCTSKSHIVQTCEFLQFCLAFFGACQRSDGRKKQNSNLLRFLRKRPTFPSLLWPKALRRHFCIVGLLTQYSWPVAWRTCETLALPILCNQKWQMSEF